MELILGGARSGKSRLAESRAISLATKTNQTLIYAATAEANDSEMAQRIQEHKTQRSQQHSNQWQLIEETQDLASLIENHQHENVCILIDCLTLWLCNCLHNKIWAVEKERFLKALALVNKNKSPLNIIMVSNEVGSGIVPLGELSREFVDQSGWLHQTLAEYCSQVTLVVAGLPLNLKG